MGPALLLIAQLYREEKRARELAPEDRLRLRQLEACPILEKLHQYLTEIQIEVLRKSPEGRAVRYALKNWKALTRYAEDGNPEIDNSATERSIAASLWVATTGCSLAAMLAAKLAPCCAVLWLPVSVPKSIPSPGSATFSLALALIPSTELQNFCLTTGFPLSFSRRAVNTLRSWRFSAAYRNTRRAG